MPKSDNQKARIFAVYQILKKYTDDTHGITKNEILKRLDNTYDIISTRQTIDSDLALLENPLGIEYDISFGKPQKYSLATRDLEFDDIKAIAESLQSNPFIPMSQKRLIIKRIKENLCSIHEAKEITLRVLPHEEALPQDEAVSTALSLIEQAIEEKHIIKFIYPHFTFTKNRLNRTDDEFKTLPLYTYFLNDKHYLCACTKVRPRYSNKVITSYSKDDIVCFEVDKITDLRLWRLTADETPMPDIEEVKEAVYEYDYSLTEHRLEKVSMEFDKELLPLIYDYFGKDVNIDRETETTLHIVQQTKVSPEFFAWIFSLGTGAKLLSPLYVTQRFKRWIASLSELYGVHKPSK